MDTSSASADATAFTGMVATEGANTGIAEVALKALDVLNTEVAMNRIYVTNLGSNVTTDELIQLFGLFTTPLLQRTCTVQLESSEEEGKSFAHLNVPQHVHSELLKMNGMEFKGRLIQVQQATRRAYRV